MARPRDIPVVDLMLGISESEAGSGLTRQIANRQDAARMAAMIPQAQRALHVPSLKTSPAGQRFLTTSSTRRFLARPAAVRLVSMGRSSP